MNQPMPQVSEDVKILAAIGHVCLQWARLEMAVLGIIVALENVPMEKGELMFSGLDVLPRTNMAIKLAEYHKLPRNLQTRIKSIRLALQGKNNSDGLMDRRNRVVHGVHRDMEDGKTTLTMVRFRHPKRDKTMTALDIHQLGVEIFELGNEAWSIFEDFGNWKFGPHGGGNSGSNAPSANTVTQLKLTERLSASFNHLWRKL